MKAFDCNKLGKTINYMENTLHKKSLQQRATGMSLKNVISTWIGAPGKWKNGLFGFLDCGTKISAHFRHKNTIIDFAMKISVQIKHKRPVYRMAQQSPFDESGRATNHF
jgi:hypothetical protein